MLRRPGAFVAVAVVAAIMGSLVAGCSSGDDDAAPTTAAPTVQPSTTVENPLRIERVGVEPNPDNVLSFALVVETSAPAEVTVRVIGGDRDFEVPSLADAATEIEVPIVGLRAETEYEFEVVATDADGNEAVEAAGPVETGALPDDIPVIDVVTLDGDRIGPGLTLLDAFQVPPPTPDSFAPGESPQLGWLIAVDDEGEVVWYHRASHPIGDVDLVPGGLLYEMNNTIGREIDLLGRVQHEWAGHVILDSFPTDQYGRTVAAASAIRVDTDSIHHEVSRLANGNTLFLSTELITAATDAPRCGEDPVAFAGEYKLISDVVIEMAPDGSVVDRWPLVPLLDPLTDPTAAALCGDPFSQTVPGWMYTKPSVDWTHGNAVSLDESRNALIVSLRHLDAVLAIRYHDDAGGAAGELLWRLGPGGTLPLTDGGAYQYHQHDPQVQADGSLLIYDNGNTRPGTTETPGTPGEPAYSRAVLYGIDDSGGDPAAWTATQRWEYRAEVDGLPAYAFFLGAVQTLDNGNVLISNGGLFGRPDGLTAQITEVVPADGPAGGEVVFEMRLSGYFVYRAHRIPSLYAGTS